MLSAIVPALNAGADLACCLERLGGASEVIVVDGGSGDDTIAVARGCGARIVAAAKGRGTQLGAGARAARGDWLLFLHADTRLGPGWREAVAAHIARLPGKAACFRFRLDDDAWQARLVERGVALRVRLLGLPYGDQGLLISRRLYDALGGYAEMPLMEDVDLARRIGAKRLALLQADAVTSAARWRRDGWLTRSARNLACLILHRLGMSAERVAKLYG